MWPPPNARSLQGLPVRHLAGVLLAAGVVSGCTRPVGGVAPWTGPQLHLYEDVALKSTGEGFSEGEVLSVVDFGATVVVLATSPPRLIEFDSLGTRLEGPGRRTTDLVGVVRPSFMGRRKEALWVISRHANQVTVVDSQTVAVSSAAEGPWGELSPSESVIALLRDGSVVVGPHPPSLTPRSPSDSGAAAVRRVPRTGEPGTALYEIDDVRHDFWRLQDEGEDGRRRTFVGRHLVEERPLVAGFPDGSGIVVVERWAARGLGRWSYRVRVYTPESGLERTLELPYEPKPVPSLRPRGPKRGEVGSGGRGDAETQGAESRAVQDFMATRPYLAPVSRVLPGADGSIWLRREVIPGLDSVAWDVVHSDGSYVGWLTTDTDVRLLWASEETLWTAVEDDGSVAIVRFHVRRGPE